MECEKIVDELNDIVKNMKFKDEIDFAIESVEEFLKDC